MPEVSLKSHLPASEDTGPVGIQGAVSVLEYAELMSVIGMAHMTNGLANTLQVDVDDVFKA